MTKVELEIHDSVVEAIEKMADIVDSGVEVVIPRGSVLFENILNLKLIKTHGAKEGKVIQLTTEDDLGKNLISIMEDGITPLEYMDDEEQKPAFKFKFPKIGLPTFRGMPKMGNKKLPLVLGITVAALLVGSYLILLANHKAAAKLVVNSQPLTRSVTITVKKDGTSDDTKKTLKGTVNGKVVENSLSMATTGETVIGKKAKGTATLFNKTTEEKKFKKGTTLEFSSSVSYVTLEDVTVPARVDSETTGEMLAGEIDVKIEAAQIGSNYNIDSEEALSVEDFKKAEFSAKTKGKIEGGESKTVKSVAAEDIKNLSLKLLEINKADGLKKIGSDLGSNQQIITGSEVVKILKESYSKEVNTQAEDLVLVQSVNVDALTYSKSELEELMDKLTKNLVPEGYILSSKEKSINVEVLGNSSSSTVSLTTADIQVTFKALIITDIKEEDIKNNLAGKTLEEAQKYLGSIRNLKTYEISVSPQVPFFRNIPKDQSKITVTIQRNQP